MKISLQSHSLLDEMFLKRLLPSTLSKFIEKMDDPIARKLEGLIGE